MFEHSPFTNKHYKETAKYLQGTGENASLPAITVKGKKIDYLQRGSYIAKQDATKVVLPRFAKPKEPVKEEIQPTIGPSKNPINQFMLNLAGG